MSTFSKKYYVIYKQLFISSAAFHSTKIEIESELLETNKSKAITFPYLSVMTAKCRLHSSSLFSVANSKHLFEEYLITKTSQKNLLKMNSNVLILLSRVRLKVKR